MNGSEHKRASLSAIFLPCQPCNESICFLVTYDRYVHNPQGNDIHFRWNHSPQRTDLIPRICELIHEVEWILCYTEADLPHSDEAAKSNQAVNWVHFSQHGFIPVCTLDVATWEKGKYRNDLPQSHPNNNRIASH